MSDSKTHPLDPLLRPDSIAVVGASERPGSVGRRTVENLLTGKFPGRLYAVNPGSDSVLGLPCFPDLASLPETVDHVVLTVGDSRIEAALDDTIAHGARAATMMSSLLLKNDHPPLLRDRISAKIEASGLVVCGANGMGFYNFADGVWVCGFDTRDNHLRGGNVTLISHSGSGMSGIIDCEERIDFNLAVSTGQEVKAGDKLVVLEAMKMLTTVSASADGIIAEVLVAKGDRVDSDDLLVRIKAD